VRTSPGITSGLHQVATQSVCLHSVRLTCHTLQKTAKFVGCDKFALADSGTPHTDVVLHQFLTVQRHVWLRYKPEAQASE
jgi:hypothetical protein